MNKIHIGHQIESRINELGISQTEFARRINTSKQNVTRILKKESVDTSALQLYSDVLDFNFFTLYCDDVHEKDEVNVVGDENQLMVNKNGAHGNIMEVGTKTEDLQDARILAERVRSLEALIAEKERMIKFLMGKGK